MLEVVLALLLQTTDPVQPAVTPPPAQIGTIQTTQTQRQQETEEEAQTRERRCRMRNLTGTRLASLVTCRSRNGQQSHETRDTLHNLQRTPTLF